jgi:biopolymer transport protein ExbD
MYQLPSRRRKKIQESKLNLIPILDAVFIFIFFLLATSNYINIFELSSEFPVISNEESPKDKKDPLSLVVEIKKNTINLFKGNNRTKIYSLNKRQEEKFKTDSLHQKIVELKKQNISEKTIIFEPSNDVAYETIIKLIDIVSLVKNTDEVLYEKDKDNISIKVKKLFPNIVFGNVAE